MRALLICFLAFTSLTLFGQDFKFKVKIDSVNESWFHKILLSPSITNHLNNNFTDIRLYSNNQEIPYLLQKEEHFTEKELFVEYEIFEKEHFKRGKYTRLVIHNVNKSEINNIVLRIKNADVRKRLKLNASNNKSDWYVLKDNYAYNSINNTENTSEIRVLNFPLSTYEYYELLIDDYFDKPINIVQAGYYNRIKENGKYSKLDNINYTKTDTLKQTIITVILNNNYVDKISFDIDAPKYYYRQAEIYIKPQKSINKKLKTYNQVIGRFKLISNSSNTFALNNLKEDTVYIRIINNDNAPISINNIELFQLNKYLVADLIAESTYELKFCDSKASKPNYDLKYFADSIPEQLKIITTQNISEITLDEKEPQDGNFNLSSYWLWIIIIIVALLLVYMSIKMVKENKVDE